MPVSARIRRSRLETLESRRLLAASFSTETAHPITLAGPALPPSTEGVSSFSFPSDQRSSSSDERSWGTSISLRRPEGESPNVVWVEDAESGLQFVKSQVDSEYSLIQSEVVSQGDHAFHLAHPNARANGFEIDRDLVIGPQTKLFFASQLSWATDLQIAKVQVSRDGGQTWPDTIFSQAGEGRGDAGFGLKEVDLSSYADQTIRIRFQYDLAFGSYYPQSTPGNGWHIDHIQITDELEKTQYSIGDPSPDAQLYLELINRSRADAIIEANRLAYESDSSLRDTYQSFGIEPADIVYQYTEQVRLAVFERSVQPLAFHPALQSIAQTHTEDLFINQFQGHTSSNNPPLPFRAGFGLSQRASAFGYQGGLGENVFSYSRSAAYGHAGFEVDWGGETPGAQGYNPDFAGQGMQNPAGHRINLHRSNYKVAGIGVINDSNGSVGPQLVTQNFGSAASAAITGVVYEDLNDNQFYDLGEGRSGVRVDVEGSAFYAISTESGGYTVPVSEDGIYDVTFRGDGYVTAFRTATISNGENQKVDYLVKRPGTSTESFDFGDASTTYPVVIDQNGARHRSGNLWLGSGVDLETDGQPTAAATGDGSDDDGITSLASAMVDQNTATTASFLVQTNAAGYIDAFIDFNLDGDWSDAGEKIFDSVSVTPGIQSLSYTIPAGAASGVSMARFRISSSGGLSSVGIAEDGEVEDHQIELLDSANDPSTLRLSDHTIIFDASSVTALTPINQGGQVVFSQPQRTSSELIVRSRDSANEMQLTIEGFDQRTSSLQIEGSDRFDFIRVEAQTLDFQMDSFDVANVERFDTRGSIDTSIHLDEDSIATSNQSPTQFQLGPGDQIYFATPENWRMGTPVTVDGLYFHLATHTQGTEILVSSPTHWTNPIDRSDVDGNGNATPVDALTIINKIRSGELFDAENRELIALESPDDFPGLFLDQNRDGRLTPSDALAVINDIRRRRSRSAETEGGVLQVIDQTIEQGFARATNNESRLIDNELVHFLGANDPNSHPLGDPSLPESGSVTPRESGPTFWSRYENSVDRLLSVEETNLEAPLWLDG